MNTNIFKSAIAALALATLTFNSCKDKEETEEEYQFPYEKVTLTLEDGMVFTDIEKYRDANFISIGEKDYSKYDIYMGTSPDSCQKKIVDDIKPFTKYYWYVVAHEPNKYDNTAQSEIRTFYYVTSPQITKVYNPEGDWATILKWEHNDYLKEATITLTPDKDCQYDKMPIVVDAAQDSCYISAGGEFNSKYAVYHQWWDDSKAQYYEPVVYSFNVTFEGEIDGHYFTLTNDSVKYIFLDRAKYAADKQFNVYRMGRIGNRTWLLEDLRGIPTYTWTHYLVVTSPLGFKACAYEYGCSDNLISDKEIDIIPEGCHLATDDDWQDLEYTYGAEKRDINDYYKGDFVLSYMPLSYVSHLKDYYESLANDTTLIFAGNNNNDDNLLEKLISKNEWKINDTSDIILNGYGVFNARPYGVPDYYDYEISRSGYSVAFLTGTKGLQEYSRIIRYLWSPNHGIGRISIENYSQNLYIFRCVKDN